jgi:signal transduction histidine kinase
VKYCGHDGARIRVSVCAYVPAAFGNSLVDSGIHPPADGQELGVRIDVEDDGPGVPKRERELVFEEFYRGDDSLSRRVEGTGIGLALSRRIVLAHGGRVECLRSPTLGGALFRVTLPPAAAGRRLALAGSGGTGGGGR